MSGKNKHQERIDEFFKNYPDEDVALVASDGQIFQKKANQWAKAHAKRNGLKIEEVERPSKDTKKSTSKDSNEETDKPLSKMKKAELEAYAKEIGIELKGKNNKERAKEIQEHLDTNFDPDKVDETAAKEGAETGEESDGEGEGSGEGDDEEFTPTGDNAEK